MSMNSRRLDSPALQLYWEQVSEQHASGSDNGLELICYAGMPPWFNNLIHRYQARAVEDLLSGLDLRGCRVLDIGTGVGRWAGLYATRGANVTGIDIEERRLRQAHARHPAVRFERMGADALGFDDATFDHLNCVTVLQHVPDDVKRRSIAEMRRTSKPRAHAVVLELTDMSDDAPHVFPWPATTWERTFREHGFTVRKRVGTEYIPLLRLAKRAYGSTGRNTSRAGIDAIKAGRRTPADRLKLAALRAAVAMSYPVEEVAVRFAPTSFARITGWLFEREA